MELRLESVWNDLGGSEGAGGRGLHVLLAGPVGLTHHEPELGHLRLGSPLLNVCPSYSLLSQFCRFPVHQIRSELEPILNGTVLRHLASHLLPSSVQAG